MVITNHTLPDSTAELRKEGDGSPGTIFGYGSVFDSQSLNLGGFVEIVRPGAFTECLRENPLVLCRVQHEGGLQTVGSTHAGTMTVGQDGKGLWYRAELPDTMAGRDLARLVGRGDINKSSFAFSLRGEGERWDFSQEPPLRELLNLDVSDCAPCTDAAYPGTSVSLRSANPAERVATSDCLLRFQTAKELSEAKRAAGYSDWHSVTGDEVNRASITAAEIRVTALKNGRHLLPKPIGYIESVRAQIAELKASAKGDYREPRSASAMCAELRKALALAEGHRADRHQQAEACIDNAWKAAPYAADRQRCLQLFGMRGYDLITAIEAILGE